ncbi:MAG: hypothetical protein RMJ19_05235 [Gemmatales bacterium]|nr:hypothetical protein [Gemmatales bacterium]MDW8175056.1 hypothetical protein [Gemmatales bacterium]
MQLLLQGIKRLTNAFDLLPAAEERLAEPLGIDARSVDRSHTQHTTAFKQFAALVVLNAMLFHEELTRSNARVRTLQQCIRKGSPKDELLKEWDKIFSQTNYHAVFDLARSISLN